MRKPYISPSILPYLTEPIYKERPQPELSNDRSYNIFQCILQKLFKKSRYPSQCEQTLVWGSPNYSHVHVYVYI